MMDKTIPYYPIIMYRKSGSEIPNHFLPYEYKLDLYKNGDEKEWFRIALSLGEFENEKQGLSYFESEFKNYEDELSRRCLFLVNPEGEKIGTYTNWWAYTGVRRDPWIKWFLLCPEYQGKGLGKKVFYEGLRQMIAIEGDREIYLHTQTWSYKGINIYRKAGFVIATVDGLGGYKNTDYLKAEEVIKPYYR